MSFLRRYKKMITSLIIVYFIKKMITIEYKGILYNIENEPNETIEDTYQRAWYIIKNFDKYAYDHLYSLSIIMINKQKGMIY